MHAINFSFSTAAVLLLGTGVWAQPPVGPDPRPKVIGQDEWNNVVGGPTLVTLKLKDVSPDQAFAAWAKEASVTFDKSRVAHEALTKKPRISIDVDGVPCLVALRSLAAKAGCGFALVRSGAGVELQLTPADDPQLHVQGPMTVFGPFVVIATAVHRTKTQALGDDAAAETYRLDFVILGDPKLLKLGMVGAPHFYDQGGWTIRAIDRDEFWGKRDSGQPPLEWRFSARRSVKPGDSKEALAFKAVADGLHVTTKTTPWVISDVTKAVAASTTVKLAEGTRKYLFHALEASRERDISGRGQLYLVRVGVSGVGVSNKRWSGWPELTPNIVRDAIRIVDDQGRDFVPYGPFKEKDFEYSGMFWSGANDPPVGAPARLIWNLPTEIRSAAIPVEFPAQPKVD